MNRKVTQCVKLDKWWHDKFGWLPRNPGIKPPWSRDRAGERKDWQGRSNLWNEYQEERKEARCSEPRELMYLGALFMCGPEPQMGSHLPRAERHAAWQKWKKWNASMSLYRQSLGADVTGQKWWCFLRRYRAWWRLKEKIGEL